MSAAAEILRDAGHTVFGMDESSAVNPAEAATRPFAQMLRWQADAIPAELDVCIASRAIPTSHPFLQMLADRNVETLSLPTFLARIFSEHRQICVAGTHGKSTSSAMLTWILHQAGRSPSCFVGAHQADLNCSGRYADSDDAVLESCEFLSSFVHLSPAIALVTGIERDHFDCFPDATAEDEAFGAFARRIVSGGVLVCRSDCERSAAMAFRAACRHVTFSAEPPREMCVSQTNRHSGRQPDWEATDIQLKGIGSECRIQDREQTCRLRLRVPGRHNILNALGAIAAAAEAGVSPALSCEALSSFGGIRRRFEIRGQYDGITLIDDYAHHPTAIRETLLTARSAFPGRRIVVAFEPHQLVRTTALFADFVAALRLADEVLVLPVYPAREQVTLLKCCQLSGQLVRRLNFFGTRAFLFANLDQIVSRIDHSGRPRDVFLTMGAGRTNLIHDELTRRLQRHSVA